MQYRYKIIHAHFPLSLNETQDRRLRQSIDNWSVTQKRWNVILFSVEVSGFWILIFSCCYRVPRVLMLQTYASDKHVSCYIWLCPVPTHSADQPSVVLITFDLWMRSPQVSRLKFARFAQAESVCIPFLKHVKLYTIEAPKFMLNVLRTGLFSVLARIKAAWFTSG